MNLSTIVTAAGDDKAMERISKARTVLVIRQPFWGTLALYLKLECTRSIETMSTDGIKLYFNPDFVLGLDFDELVGCIAHEVSHCAYRHHVRRGKRELGLWNDAADLVINPLLRAAGFKLPDGALEESRFNGLASEEVYARLYSEREAKKKAAGGQGQTGSSGSTGGNGQPSLSTGNAPGQPQQGQPGSSPGGPGAGSPQPQPIGAAQPGSPASGGGSSAPGQPQPGSGSCPWGQVTEPVKEHEAATAAAIEAEWEVRVRQAIAVANSKHAGSLPMDIQRLKENVEAPAKVDWRERLRQFINDKVVCDYSWVHRNRRFPDIILPGQIVNSVQKLGIAVDTSGSRNDRALALVENEVQDIMDTGSVAELVVIYCDTKVQRVERFTAGEGVSLKHKGGGGTKFAPAIEWFEENEPDVAAILYFTDLEVNDNDWGKEPQQPVLWLGCGFASKIELLAKNAPFGEVVHIEE